MRSLKKLLSVVVLFTSLIHLAHLSQAYASIDISKIEADLKSTGVEGYVHGMASAQQLLVFTYRNPNDFFENIQLPMTTSDYFLMTDLLKLKRHQKVKVFGEFVSNGAPLKHLNISKFELLKDYVSELDSSPYSYKASAEDVKQKTELIGRVHATDQNGKVLVIEYRDLVFPVFVSTEKDIEIVNQLYRGDKIKLEYKPMVHPGAPLHLKAQAKTAGQPSLEILEEILDWNAKPVTLEGYLVRFPKSPQIKFDVFALLFEDKEGSNIQFTLVNFTDQEAFQKLREKLEAAWVLNPSKIENGRNKWIHKGVKVKAKGLGNVQSKAQANPQILIEKVEDLEVISAE
jgi:hypothetical protein